MKTFLWPFALCVWPSLHAVAPFHASHNISCAHDLSKVLLFLCAHDGGTKWSKRNYVIPKNFPCDSTITPPITTAKCNKVFWFGCFKTYFICKISLCYSEMFAKWLVGYLCGGRHEDFIHDLQCSGSHLTRNKLVFRNGNCYCSISSILRQLWNFFSFVGQQQQVCWLQKSFYFEPALYSFHTAFWKNRFLFD